MAGVVKPKQLQFTAEGNLVYGGPTNETGLELTLGPPGSVLCSNATGTAPDWEILSLDDLGDIDFSSTPNIGDILVYNGTHWVPQISPSGATSIYRQSFVDADLTSGTITITHNLGQKYIIAQIYDENDELMVPDNIKLLSMSQCELDLFSFGTIIGTWNVTIIG